MTLRDANFTSVEIQYVQPTFLQGHQKSLASSHLESLSEELIGLKIATLTELKSLIIELKSIEKRNDTMISLPSIYQIWGYK